jgi:hypothetical protein
VVGQITVWERAFLYEAAPGVRPAEARRIAAYIAKLPELLQKP